MKKFGIWRIHRSRRCMLSFMTGRNEKSAADNLAPVALVSL